MIKLVILDVDGVILGDKQGINFPFPTKRVTEYLAKLQDSGMIISLCTGKPSFTVKRIIKKMRLDNLHISDGGAVIFDPIDNRIIKSATIPQDSVKQLLTEAQDHLAFWQLYTLEHKFVLAGKFPSQFQEDKEIMPWVEVDDLLETASNSSLTKIELVYTPESESYYRELLKKYENVISIQWTDVPNILPNKLIIITAKGVDKKSAVKDLSNYYKVKSDEILAVGDTMMDWKFMEGCGYVATVSNANFDVQNVVKARRGFVGGHVDNDGVIDVLEYFNTKLSSAS